MLYGQLPARLTVSEGTGSARYDARSESHYHFRCLRTGMVHDLPTRFDPELISLLDPGLTQELKEQGFQVTGYRLELLGYRDDGPGTDVAAAINADAPPSGINPIFVNASMKNALSEANTTSQARARDTPTPAAGPWTTATTGWRRICTTPVRASSSPCSTR